MRETAHQNPQTLLFTLCLAVMLAGCGGEIAPGDELLDETGEMRSAVFSEIHFKDDLVKKLLLFCPPSSAFTCPADYEKVKSGTYTLGSSTCPRYVCGEPQCPVADQVTCPAGSTLLTASYNHRGRRCTTKTCSTFTCPTYVVPSCTLPDFKLVKVPILHPVSLGFLDSQQIFGEVECKQYACSNAYCKDGLSTNKMTCVEGYELVPQAYVEQNKYLCYSWDCEEI